MWVNNLCMVDTEAILIENVQYHENIQVISQQVPCKLLAKNKGWSEWVGGYSHK